MSLVEQLMDSPPEFPPGWDADKILRGLRTPTAWARGDGGRTYRRGLTRNSPMLFGLLYFGNRLTAPDGSIYLTDMHLALCQEARGWRAVDPQAPPRAGVVGPRESGKSVWCDEILSAWAVAHGWWQFPHLWSYTGRQGKAALANLRAQMSRYPLLLDDFPELRPATFRGAANRQDRIDFSGGGAIAAAGLSETVLGARAQDLRPGPLIIDDGEPLKGHTPKLKRQLLDALTREVLPMNPRSPVLLVGTPTMYGSITHDLVRAGRPDQREDWPMRHRFATIHWPALITDAGGAMRSLWPRRWPLAGLLADRDRDPEGFALNMQCDPTRPGGPDGVTYWVADQIRYDPRAMPSELVVAVDVAVTRNERSDFTTIVVVGLERARRRAVIVHAAQGKWTLLELQQRLWDLHQANPTLTRGVIETNQGGQLWLDNMSLPPGLHMTGVHETSNKTARIRALHRRYQVGNVVHLRKLAELEQQMLDWPQVEHDDLVDVAARGVAEALEGVA